MLMDLFKWLVSYGAAFIVPLFALILGGLFGAPFKRSFAGALKMGVGFTALGVLIGTIFSALEPAARELANKFGVNFTILDLGWPTQSGIVFAIPWCMAGIALMILCNALLVTIGLTKTLNVDFNNHWIFIFYMGATYYLSKNWLLTIAVGIAFWFISLKMADWVYPYIQPYYNMPTDGLTVTHAYSILWAPIGFLLDQLWDRVPVVKDINWNAQDIQRKFGFFGESIFIGWVIGFIVGCVAFMTMPPSLEQLGKALSLGFTVALFMYLIPRAAELVVAGMAPLSEAIRKFLRKRMPGRECYVGLDAAILVGAPEHVVIGLLTTPIAFLIAFVLPGNQVLPMGDVAGLFIFICTFLTNTNRGNIFRGLLNATLLLIPVSFLIGAQMAPANVAMATATHFAVTGAKGMLFTSLCVGTTPVGFALFKIAMFIGVTHKLLDLFIGLAILTAFFIVWYLMRNRPSEYVTELLHEGKE
ncbi:PTS transporter subunit IIC [Atopobacter sp. AH10]|uniref:PTS transporter subunit IIC n=1 Tax=Atopobacter sp. AH10 TaxID=2315861 RepID=UPI0013141F28|nr:PTS transporter subunit IIC [Atopobacter sp. AH10]